MGKNDATYEKVAVEDVTLVRSTVKAGLYRTPDGSEYWIPFSQISEDSVDKDGTSGTLWIPRWLAEEKDMDYDEE